MSDTINIEEVFDRIYLTKNGDNGLMLTTEELQDIIDKGVAYLKDLDYGGD